MKRPSLVSQGSLQRLVSSAHDAWRRCNFPKAIETMERASRLCPSNPEIFFQLGRMHGLRQNYAAAESSFEQAIRIAPRKTAAIAMAGTHSKEFLNSDLNESYLRRAAEQTDAIPEIWIDLAAACERKRRLGEAIALCERALKTNVRCGAALLVRARLERQAGNLETAEQLLRSLPADSSLNVSVRAGYELGTVLDRQGRYDEAMTEFKKAKAQLITESQRHLAELKIVRASFNAMLEMISADLVQQWSAAGQELQPPHRLVLLGGHPRSGTTLLEQVLDAHPGIVSAEESPVFLNDAYLPLKRNSPQNSQMLPALEAAGHPALLQSRAAYFRSMELEIGGPAGHRLLLDKNPVINYLIPAFVRIFPETKFLVALRDPRDVVLSCFMQSNYIQNETLNPVTAACLSLAGTVEDYTAVMSIWRRLAPLLPAPWLEVRYEDMVNDLPSVARKTLEFLGVPWDDRVLGFDEHARQKTVRSPTYADVTQPVYKRAVGRWRNYQKYLEPHLEKLEPFVKSFGYE